MRKVLISCALACAIGFSAQSAMASDGYEFDAPSIDSMSFAIPSAVACGNGLDAVQPAQKIPIPMAISFNVWARPNNDGTVVLIESDNPAYVLAGAKPVNNGLVLSNASDSYEVGWRS